MDESIIVDFEDIFGTFDMGKPPIPDVSSGDGIIRSDEECKAWAEESNCDLLKAANNQLFIDIDTEAQYVQFEMMLSLLSRHFNYKLTSVLPSRQGLPHRHIIMTFVEDLPLLARIALQATLGSDPMRELISVKRALNGEDKVVLFFEKRTEKETHE